MANRNPNTSGLRPANTLTKRERSKIGSKGGKRSQQVQKERKLQRELLAEILSLNAPVTSIKQVQDVLGRKKAVSNEEVVLARIVQLARDEGSLSAATFIRDTLGQNPTNKVDHTSDGNPICAAIVPDRQSLDEWVNDGKKCSS